MVCNISLGDELRVKIEGEGRKGDGVAKHEGMVIFVNGGKTGDKLFVRITQIFPKFCRGEIVKED